ncbi:MAG: hypothetical protein JW716_04260 [Candidatus Aenigmarchaeota archaeon]|nr:hypothetical protein [Candidatus Aenigmarchaeota archaeon]
MSIEKIFPKCINYFTVQSYQSCLAMPDASSAKYRINTDKRSFFDRLKILYVKGKVHGYRERDRENTKRDKLASKISKKGWDNLSPKEKRLAKQYRLQ